MTQRFSSKYQYTSVRVCALAYLGFGASVPDGFCVRPRTVCTVVRPLLRPTHLGGSSEEALVVNAEACALFVFLLTMQGWS